MDKFYSPARALLLLLLLAASARSQISYQSIGIAGLFDPIDIAIPPNASPANGSTRMFIAQQNGFIKLWNGSTLLDFADLSSIVLSGGERGLLSMTFHPSYTGTSTGNRDFFVYYTRAGDGALVVARYRTKSDDPEALDPAGGTVIITPIDHSAFSNHNGGDLNFGPDGFLYLTTGDGGGGGDPLENAQNPAALLGKLLKIDLSASIPITPQVVDIGFRNPFRWSFDRSTGDAWIGDVGQGGWEEIDFKPAGSSGLNFGWDCYEGNTVFESAGCPSSGFTFPSYVYPNPAEGQAVVGGYVYRGTEFPELQGWYVATDYYSGRVYRRSPGGTWFAQTGGETGIASFGEAPDGTVYAVSQFSDALYKLTVTGPLPVLLSGLSARRVGDITELNWTTSSEQNTAGFRIEFSLDAGNFQSAGRVAASRNPGGSSYSFQHHYVSAGALFYRLAIEEDDGSISHSSILKVSSDDDQRIKIYPTVITNGVVHIRSLRPAGKLQLFDSRGIVVFERALNNTAAQVIHLPSLPRGIYIVQISGEKITREKIIVQ